MAPCQAVTGLAGFHAAGQPGDNLMVSFAISSSGDRICIPPEKELLRQRPQPRSQDRPTARSQPLERRVLRPQQSHHRRSQHRRQPPPRQPFWPFLFPSLSYRFSLESQFSLFYYVPIFGFWRSPKYYRQLLRRGEGQPLRYGSSSHRSKRIGKCFCVAPERLRFENGLCGAASPGGERPHGVPACHIRPRSQR